MSKLRMKLMYCSECDGAEEILIDLDRHEEEPTPCPVCTTPLVIKWRPEAPMPLRASYHDGYNRFAEEKEWAKLEKERVATDYRDPKRKWIASEQKRLRGMKTKEQRFGHTDKNVEKQHKDD